MIAIDSAMRRGYARHVTGRQDAERSIEQLCRAGEHDEATAQLLRTFGPEIAGLLAALAGDDTRAADAYSLFCERVWRALPGFRFESSVRTWAYVIARRSVHDVARAALRGPRLAARSELPEVAQQARSSTEPYLRTTNKRRLRELRALLSADDQLLMVLRLDRDMGWDAIARVMSDDDAPDPELLRRQSVVLRKRFSRLKARLVAEFRALPDP